MENNKAAVESDGSFLVKEKYQLVSWFLYL